MLEYFTYKKVKKHQAEKKAEAHIQSPVITEEDEDFLTRIVSAEGTPPPLPERPRSTEVPESTGNRGDGQLAVATAKGKENEKPIDRKKSNRLSFLYRKNSKKASRSSPNVESHSLIICKQDKLKPIPVVSQEEATKEEDDINRVLDDLNLAAVNNRAFSISKESQELVQKFTVILKDLVNGVPTAYDDLVHLLDDSQGTLSKSYEHLPSFLKKLITQLPDKMTSHLAPELLAVAAEAQGLNAASASKGGLSGVAKNFFKVSSLKDLVAKPGAVVSLLKTILNALKVRWPAFMGTNVLLSLALFGK
jgi:hypothetical protein